MKRILLAFTILFCFFAENTFSQIKVTGYVFNEANEPLVGALVKVNKGVETTRTVDNGYFEFLAKPNTTYTLKISYINHFSTSKTITVQTQSVSNLKIVLKEKMFDIVNVEHIRPGDFIDGFPPVELNRIPSTTGNFEDMIKVVGLGVNSTNELTSNYNVRGGNYDENLIYVNGIEIYRPFLARSGQQEGLSFINSAFVENIFFSAGGFDSYYGDKLSSVLDIRYREPLEFGGSAQASLMGGQAHTEGRFAGRRGNYITGARYRSNAYLLNSLPTKGDYNPTFFDYQFLTNFYLDYQSPGNYKKLFALGHYSANNYRFKPKSRTTNWGTVNEAYQLRVFFEGEEETKFRTFTAATGIETVKNDRLKLSFVGSVFHSVESEHYDVLAEYLINELETDPAKEDFGDSTSNIGVGGLLDHARNDLNVWIGNVYHNGKYDLKKKKNEQTNKTKTAELFWGAKLQYEQFEDKLSEWSLIDSAGYSIPLGSSDKIELKEVIKQDNFVETFRTTGYFQYARTIISYKPVVLNLKKKIRNDSTKEKSIITYHDTLTASPAKFSLNIGTRMGYRSYNNENWITPRMSLTYTPRNYFITKDTALIRRNVKFRFASGLYYQPPLYRTMRGILGAINPAIVAQKSWHNVLGADIYLNLWDRPFKFQTEAYYKHMWDVVPYEIDNVRIRYYGENSAVAYAYGVDAKINGEFVKGVESFFRIGYLKTEEDILNDRFVTYLNEKGDTIDPSYTFVEPGSTFQDLVADSIVTKPGWIRRPTDQRVTFSVFFQDKMPKFENLKVSVNLILGTNLPYGPPTYERYKDILRTKPYLRLDLGFMYDIINKESRFKYADKRILKHFEQFTISLDAFNLLGINNVVSYQWLQDIAGRYYSIPNNLTGRRVNLRLIVKF